MYDFYEDYREPSEVELIIYEAQQKINELVKPNVKKEVKKLNETVESLKKEIRILKNEKDAFKREVRDMETRHEKEIDGLKSEFIKKIGETISKEHYVVSYSYQSEKVRTIETEIPKIKVEEKVNFKEFTVKKFHKRLISSLMIDEDKNIVLSWRDDDDFLSMDEIEINDCFDLEKLKDKLFYRQAFSNEEDAQLYANYLKSIDEKTMSYKLVDDTQKK